MQNIGGFARVLAKARVKQQQRKPLFGAPFLLYGQCYALSGYFFQLGTVLGAKHRDHSDEFGHAFLGLHGEPGAMMKFFSGAIEDQMPLITEAMTSSEFVLADQMRRVEYTGDPSKYLMDRGTQKLKVETVSEIVWQYAEQGAILGVMRPDIIRRMFDQTHKPASQEEWDHARAAGLDIPAKQDLPTYEETEEGENTLFLAYCQEICPAYHATLTR